MTPNENFNLGLPQQLPAHKLAWFQDALDAFQAAYRLGKAFLRKDDLDAEAWDAFHQTQGEAIPHEVVHLCHQPMAVKRGVKTLTYSRSDRGPGRDPLYTFYLRRQGELLAMCQGVGFSGLPQVFKDIVQYADGLEYFGMDMKTGKYQKTPRVHVLAQQAMVAQLNRIYHQEAP